MSRPRDVKPALAFCVCVGLMAAMLAHATQNLQVFTSEGARRAAIAAQPVPWPTVVLQTHTGQHLDPARPCEGPRLVDFIYTRCDSVCQALGSAAVQLARSAAAHAQTTGKQPVAIWSISLDSEHDQTADLARYRQRHLGVQDAPSDRAWQVLRLPQSRDQQQLLDAFSVVKIPDGLGGWEHNAAWSVLDAQCRLVRMFDLEQGEAALAYAQKLP